MKNLRVFDATRNNISDISPLANCTKLQTLFLMENSITNIQPLRYCTELTKLHLYKNNIKDLSPLSNCTKLLELNIDRNQITDISPITGCKDLNMLYLGSNNVDLSLIKSFTKLERIQLTGMDISDLSMLNNPGGFREIIIDTNPKTNTATLAASMKNLRMKEGGVFQGYYNSGVAIFASKADAEACKAQILKNSGIKSFTFNVSWFENGTFKEGEI